ncbi:MULTISPECIES: flagellar basal body-associated FliL family protein [unclassified Sporolactobacillus]|uniref:flagellar basal body-associated FliL family protein n=1 Tax=unclassified Sporolactobacillus TaxID=2628533 RepID=UPI002367717C|nr:flagellar basal body-associated FliL family protein [Sporolactobacillus sp. CQH2019]MDD9147057.1 flagellar basal body-associated FliL family protein [Sporolactobacillus sp. CQH2019]
MFKNRVVGTLFVIMALMIIGIAAAFFVMNRTAQSKVDVKNPTIDQIVNNLTVTTGEITTNISGDHFIKVDFKIQVSNSAAKDELTKRSFEVKNAVIYTVSGMKPADVQDQKGIANLENLLRNRLNGFLKSGTVTHVYTTEKIVQ